MTRLCLECVHCMCGARITLSQHKYPAADIFLWCNADHGKDVYVKNDARALLTAIRRAETCEDFEEVTNGAVSASGESEVGGERPCPDCGCRYGHKHSCPNSIWQTSCDDQSARRDVNDD